ncbi:MAG: adenylate/guanylate cyclase domain-containing protein [Chloroflexota bacterium]
MERPLSSRALTLIWLAGLGLSVAASSLSAANGRPPGVFLPVGISSAVYVTSGYAMARRRPANRIGYLLGAIGLFQAAQVALRHLIPVTEVANVALGPVGPVILAYVLLAYPSGVLAGRIERWAVGGIALTFALLAVATVFTVEPVAHGTSRCPPCVPNPLRITDLGVFPFIDDLNSVAVVASGLIVSVLCFRRWWLAREAARRVLAPVLFGGIVTGLGFAVIGIVSAVGLDFSLGAQVLLLLQILIPIALAVTFVYVYAARGAVSGAVVQLGASPRTEALEDALRHALGDPELIVARWSAAAGAYLDREGQRVDLDRLDVARAALRLEREGQPLATVVHDATLNVDAELVATVADAVRFSVESTELRDQLRARGGDVANLPRGEVTFLFGDLEGSTEMLSALGDAYIDVLAELRRIVREVTDRFGGRVVDARADECFLAFADPSQAMVAAGEIQRRLGDAIWPAGAAPRMRIGLHCGTPDLTADGYVGIDVHRAARVMATAQGGQIVASATVATAVGERVPQGVNLVPLGYVSLKGISEPEFLYRVVSAPD